MPRPRALIALFALVVTGLVGGLSGCSKDSGTTNTNGLPDGATLTAAAATAMRDVNSAHISLVIQGDVSSLPLRRADGDLLRGGDAKGTIQLEQSGALIEYDFVLVGGSIYLKGVSGGWQKLPAAAAAGIYDPSAILDPDRGVSRLLATATGAKTEGTDTIDGANTYRVSLAFNGAAVAAVVPGVSEGVTGTVWLDSSSKRLRRAILTVGGAVGGKTGTITINLTDLDKPVSISAPS
jgi:lipoprotein LprG